MLLLVELRESMRHRQLSRATSAGRVAACVGSLGFAPKAAAGPKVVAPVIQSDPGSGASGEGNEPGTGATNTPAGPNSEGDDGGDG